MAELADLARTTIASNRFMVLGTVDPSGRPRVSPVWFSLVDHRVVYWLSSPTAQHSRNIEERREVSIVVFDSSADPHTGQAVYLEAIAGRVPDEELAAQWELIARADGHRLLPRLIRYIEERRRDEARYTGAIERHPSPLHVVWGVDDPIAVVAMTDRLRAARPDAVVELLDGVGHYPMIESPARFAAAVRRGLQPAA